jgi:hypothetical protein
MTVVTKSGTVSGQGASVAVPSAAMLYANEPTEPESSSSRQNANEIRSHRSVTASAAIAFAFEAPAASIIGRDRSVEFVRPAAGEPADVQRDDEIDDRVLLLRLEAASHDLEPARLLDLADRIIVELSVATVVKRDSAYE